MPSDAVPFAIDPDKDVSYINMTLLNASRAVEEGVKGKLKEKASTMTKFPLVRKAVSKERVQNKLATGLSSKVKPSMIAKGMADKVPKLLSYKMHETVGMKVAARTVFIEDAYLVIEFQVRYVDSQKLLAKVKEGPPDDGAMDDEDMDVDNAVLDEWIKEQQRSEEINGEENPQRVSADDDGAGTDGGDQGCWRVRIADMLEHIITHLLPDRTRDSLEHDKLPAVVQKKITEEMQAIMEKKLAQKHLEAEISVLPSKFQSRYFFENLSVIRECQIQKEI